MPIFTRADLRSRINAAIKNKIGMLTDGNGTINQAARIVATEISLRSLKRRVVLAPGLISDDNTQYLLPDDFSAIIGLHYQALDKRNQIGITPGSSIRSIDNVRLSQFELVPIEYWIQQPKAETIAFEDVEQFSTLRARAVNSYASKVLTSFDTISAGGGTWTSFGGASNVAADGGRMVLGNGSIRFDVSAAVDTTAGVQNTSMTPFDFSSYLTSNGVVTGFVDIPNELLINGFELRIGTDASNYYAFQVTTNAAGNVFKTGINTLRFDLNRAVATGSPSSTAATYCALFMNKDVTKVSQSDFRFDQLTFRLSDVYEIDYYSWYPWVAIDGTRKLNSTVDSDKLMADPDEFELYVQKGIEYAAPEVDEDNAMQTAATRYSRAKKAYEMGNPSDAMLMTYEYQKFL